MARETPKYDSRFVSGRASLITLGIGRLRGLVILRLDFSENRPSGGPLNPSRQTPHPPPLPKDLILPHLYQNSLLITRLCQRFFLTHKTQSQPVRNPPYPALSPLGKGVKGVGNGGDPHKMG